MSSGATDYVCASWSTRCWTSPASRPAARRPATSRWTSRLSPPSWPACSGRPSTGPGCEFVVDCPALDEPVYIDRDMWEKVILNLLSNALKFTFDGTLTLRLICSNTAAELSVRDTGIGIDEASTRAHLFEAVLGPRQARGGPTSSWTGRGGTGPSSRTGSCCSTRRSGWPMSAAGRSTSRRSGHGVRAARPTGADRGGRPACSGVSTGASSSGCTPMTPTGCARHSATRSRARRSTSRCGWCCRSVGRGSSGSAARWTGTTTADRCGSRGSNQDVTDQRRGNGPSPSPPPPRRPRPASTSSPTSCSAACSRSGCDPEHLQVATYYRAGCRRHAGRWRLVRRHRAAAPVAPRWSSVT